MDNTFLSPYFQRPFELGADIILHSGTKFLSGHNDTLAGFIVVNTPELSEKLRYIIKTTGAGLAPFDSWLVLRGIKTLPIRMEKAQENAQAIVEFLLQEKKVKNVYYPGIPGTNNYEVCKSQASGFGSMLTFEVESKALALHILESLKLIPFAESLGGVETLITYPTTQTHADVPEEILIKNGITVCISSIYYFIKIQVFFFHNYPPVMYQILCCKYISISKYFSGKLLFHNYSYITLFEI